MSQTAVPTAAVFQAHALHFAHPASPPLFAGRSIDLPPGLVRLEGEPGGGKTTLLRLLAGDLPCRGEFWLRGQRLAPASAEWRRQVHGLDPRDARWDDLTPAGLRAAWQAVHPQLDEAAWARHVAGFSLEPHAAKPLYMLSTGSRRKAALAVALSAGCAVTLLDEPTAGLDRPSVAWLAQALTELSRASPRQTWLLAAAYGLEDALPWAATVTL